MDLHCIAKILCQELLEIRKALNITVSLLGESIKVLAEIYKSQFTKEIKNDQYRTAWENFSVAKLTPILTNNLSVEAACQVRVHVCFGTAVLGKVRSFPDFLILTFRLHVSRV